MQLKLMKQTEEKQSMLCGNVQCPTETKQLINMNNQAASEDQQELQEYKSHIDT